MGLCSTISARWSTSRSSSSTPVIHRAIGCWRPTASMPWSGWLRSGRKKQSRPVTRTALLRSSRPLGPSIGAQHDLLIQFARLKPELDNLRAALDWSSRNDSELEIALAGAAAWLWLGSGLDAEGIAACERAISHISTKTAPALEARALSELARLGVYVLPLERALQALDRAIALYRDTNDSVGLYLALARKAGSLLQVETSSRHAAPSWNRRAWKPKLGPYAYDWSGSSARMKIIWWRWDIGRVSGRT